MASQTKNLSRLLRIVAQLRGPNGCPWDREQTHQTIRHNLIEECYEVLDAMDSGDTDAFQDELGDLLMQVVFHAQMASENGKFVFDDVSRTIAEKLIRRHPHVFGKQRIGTSEQVLKQWEAIKKKEKKSDSILSDLPKSLPALLKADKVQRKVARVGFDWKHVDDVVKKVEEELAELKVALAKRKKTAIKEELGDLLFAAVNLARFQHFQAEDVLNHSTNKFVSRFQALEKSVQKKKMKVEDCSPEELDEFWETVKRKNRKTKKKVAV